MSLDMIQRVIRRYTLVAILLIVIASIFLPPLAVLAETTSLSQNQLDSIRLNCKNAQLTMQQLQKNDAVARINRGRAYDLMLNQISAFNSRLAYNKIVQPQFVQLASDLQNQIDTFRTAYNTYDGSLSDAIRVDCKGKPTDFYDLIVTTRQQRMNMGSIVSQIEQLSASYRDELVKYQTSLSSPTRSGVTQ